MTIKLTCALVALLPMVSETLQQALHQKMQALDAEENLILASPGIATNQVTRPPAATNAPVFEVKGYQLRGNTLLPSSVTAPILQPHIGPAISLDEVRHGLADLQGAYRDRGYATVVVTLPPQQLTNGIVQVQVTEGRLAEINVLNNRYFSSNNIMRDLPSLRTNAILNALVFQQELDRANANRDRQIYPVLSPGPEPGTTILDLKVKDQLPFHLRFELDNYSIPNTPELRANFSAVHDNLWQLNHQAGLQYSFSPESYKEGNYLFYDRPLIANYSAFYRVPLSGVNGPPRPVDYSSAAFGYDEATRRFRPPPATGASELLFYASRSFSDTGSQVQSSTLTPNPIPPEGGLQIQEQIVNRTLNPNEDLGARFSLPLPESHGVAFSFSAGPDFKNYRSTLTQVHSFQGILFVPAFGTNGPPWDPPGGFRSPPTNTSRVVFTSVQYVPLSFSLQASTTDRHGSTVFNFGESFNLVSLGQSGKDFAAVAGSTNANGNYFVITSGLTREEKLPGDWGLHLHADGQWANQPLISNEQFSLGGQAGVRGYRDGAEYGDTGWRVQIEPHSPYFNAGLVFDKVPLIARGYSFVDYGERYLLDPGSRKRSVAMLGTGAGLDVSIGEHVELRVCMGIPLLDTPDRSAFQPRATFSLAAQW